MTMSSTEKIKMTLHIGGTQIVVAVPFENQEMVRQVEKSVDNLYKTWRHDFPTRTDREVLAMVAYQFASYYTELQARYAEAGKKAEQCLLAIEQLDADATGAIGGTKN